MKCHAILMATLLCSVPASGHWIPDKHGRVYSTPGHRDPMCTHNRAHQRGLEHPNGVWIHKGTKVIARATELVKPELAPTPHGVVTAVLHVIQPTKDDILFDLGCGDGRFVIAAAKHYGCMAVGVEINYEQAMKANVNVVKAGLTNRVLIRTGNARDESLLGAADIVIMYLYPDLITELLPKLANAHTIVSISHQLPRVRQTRYRIGDRDVYVFRKGEK